VLLLSSQVPDATQASASRLQETVQHCQQKRPHGQRSYGGAEATGFTISVSPSLAPFTPEQPAQQALILAQHVLPNVKGGVIMTIDGDAWLRRGRLGTDCRSGVSGPVNNGGKPISANNTWVPVPVAAMAAAPLAA
jgi:hypothetical protein